MTKTRPLTTALLTLVLALLPSTTRAQAADHGKHAAAAAIQANPSALLAVARLHVESARELGASDPQSQLESPAAERLPGFDTIDETAGFIMREAEAW